MGKLIFKAYKKTDKIFFHNFLYKMVKNYYKKNKERLPKKAHEKYQNLREEEKDKRCQ